MNAVASVAGVGTSQAQIQVQYQAAVLAKQKAVAEGLGEAAIKLIQAAMANPDLGNNINMTA
ncbi:MAG: cytoplasmic protein [Candidatus Hydrogenedentota bacterium]